jgi:hypothetical protein
VDFALMTVRAGTPECLANCAQSELRVKTAGQIEADLSGIYPVEAQSVTALKAS